MQAMQSLKADGQPPFSTNRDSVIQIKTVLECNSCIHHGFVDHYHPQSHKLK